MTNHYKEYDQLRGLAENSAQIDVQTIFEHELGEPRDHFF